jgi:hypothetical protein
MSPNWRRRPSFERPPLNRVFVNSTLDTGGTVGKTDSQNLTPIGNNKPQKDLPIKSPCTDHLLLILQFTLVERVAPEPELRSIVIQTRLIQTQAAR